MSILFRVWNGNALVAWPYMKEVSLDTIGSLPQTQGCAEFSEPCQPYTTSNPNFLVLANLLVWFCPVFLHCPTPMLILFPCPCLYTDKASPGISIPSCMRACLLSCVWFSETLWTVAARILCPWGFPGRSTGVGSHFLLQGIFPIEGLNPCLLCHLHW